MADFERETPATQVVTTAEAKLHLRQDLPVDDDLIDDIIAAAMREVEDYGQIALIRQTVTATFDLPISSGRIRLPVGPVQAGATASVTIRAPDGTETALDSQFFSLWVGRSPSLWIVDGSSLPSALRAEGGGLVVEYAAGFGTEAAAVPHDLRHAVLDQVAQLYEHRGTWRQHRHEPSMSAHAIRVAQRYRRSSVG